MHGSKHRPTPCTIACKRSLPRLLAGALAAALAVLPLSGPAQAQSRDHQNIAGQNVAGQFDYYVLALSWAPSWCRSVDDPRDANSCDPGRRAHFVTHGLWPQHERGWPADCPTTHRNPTRAETRAMVDVTGSSGLAWYQWRKHGRCSGLSATAYFDAMRRASGRIRIPEVLSGLNRDIRLPARVVEDAFIEANPDLSRDGITVTCRGADLQEVRICLNRDLSPRACAPDTRRDCARDMVMPAPN
ncbi:ribonuclease T2 [Paracoccus sp. DMF-8]|uniref:ribonuclease T2 n=1 Tax=Paracoccus sp. DMF-8 TaxID=3019445 RepID=UPI0023E7D98A|nr:ribonuclease T2 [Paracoccus sp. DMF-8]MDF3605873.1 ribonuclease T2 [Paracoccus sp. DMF-8]